jgi:phosphate:Na+ symporter
MEFEIAHYLEQVGNEHLSDDTKHKIRDMLRQIGELESIGDVCYKTARTIQHLRDGRSDFNTQQYSRLHEMMQLVNEALTQMMVIVSGRREDLSIDASQDIERDINNLRDRLKAESLSDINSHAYSYAIGSLYTDIIADCERLGDYVMNVVEARLGKRFLTFRSLQISLDRKTVSIDGQPVNLTRTEFDLLVLLLKNRGNVLSRQQLMDAVWAGVIVTDRTLNVHITRLRKKIGTYARHIVSRQGFGYVFEVE